MDPDLVETNIVMFEVVQSKQSTQELQQAFKNAGVLLNAIGDRVFRGVTHLDVNEKDIEKTGRILSSVLAT